MIGPFPYYAGINYLDILSYRSGSAAAKETCTRGTGKPQDESERFASVRRDAHDREIEFAVAVAGWSSSCAHTPHPVMRAFFIVSCLRPGVSPSARPIVASCDSENAPRGARDPTLPTPSAVFGISQTIAPRILSVYFSRSRRCEEKESAERSRCRLNFRERRAPAERSRRSGFGVVVHP